MDPCAGGQWCQLPPCDLPLTLRPDWGTRRAGAGHPRGGNRLGQVSGGATQAADPHSSPTGSANPASWGHMKAGLALTVLPAQPAATSSSTWTAVGHPSHPVPWAAVGCLSPAPHTHRTY